MKFLDLRYLQKLFPINPEDPNTKYLSIINNVKATTLNCAPKHHILMIFLTIDFK
jgi:hypothetical protein